MGVRLPASTNVPAISPCGPGIVRGTRTAASAAIDNANILIPFSPAPAPAAFGCTRADDDKRDRERCEDGDQLQRLMGELDANQNGQCSIADSQRPALPADRRSGPIAVALWRKPFGTIAHAFVSLGGRPRLRAAGAFNFTPRVASASRIRHSTCALTLRNSAAAQRSTADHKAGSTLRG